MRRVLTTAAATLLAVLPLPARAAAPIDDGRWTVYVISGQPLRPPSQAPADRYFGVQRLSNLGVRSMLHDMVLEGTSPLALPQQLERIDGIESALTDWQEQYPSDSWLPGTMLDFASFLQTKAQPFTDDLAIGYLYYVSARYSRTPAGRSANATLAQYVLTPPFDVSTTPPPQLHASVGDNLFPKTRR